MQGPRQESQPLPRFHRRTRQNDAVHTLGQQRRDRHRHRKISLPRTRRADSKHHVVLLDSLKIAPLVDTFGLHRAASEGALATSIGQPAQRGIRVRGQHPQHAVQVAIVEAVAGALQALVIGKDLLGARHIASRTLQLDPVRPQIDGNVQPVFQHAQILIPRAEQRLDVRSSPNALLHSVSRRTT